jgi:hypothetical protein
VSENDGKKIEGFRNSGIEEFKTRITKCLSSNPESLILYPMPFALCPMLNTLTPDT